MSDDLMDIDSPQNPSQLSLEKKRKHKNKDQSPSKKRKHAATPDDSKKVATLDSPKKSKKDKAATKHHVVAVSDAAKPDPESPFRLINATMYLPLSPISISPTHASASLVAEHLAPLLLTYYPPFRGIVMAYSNTSISSRPPTANQLNPSGDNPKPLTLALTANEYGVLYLYLTATFLVFSPQKGHILEGWVNVQSEGFLGAVAYNLFSVGIERKRLPADWKWVPPHTDEDEEYSAAQTTRTKGVASAPTSGDEDESSKSSSDFDPRKEHFTPLPKPVTNPIEMEEAAQDGQGEDELDATGYFESVSGHPVRGTIRFRVRDIDVIPGADPDRGFISIEGTMLTPEEEAQVEDNSSWQSRSDSTSMTGAITPAADTAQPTEKETSSKKKEKKEKKDKKEKKSKNKDSPDRDMVGVSGRSKGCANCKSRHIKCDETRPYCNRCKKSGLQCRGYERKMQFVDETQWTRGKHQASAVTLSRRGYTTNTADSSSAFWNSTDLSKKLDPLIIMFLRGAFGSLNVDFTSWHYSPADGAVVRRPYLPGITLQALALSFHGRINRSDASIRQAVELYGLAIRNVRTDLLTGSTGLSTPWLISSIIHMVMYEWVQSTNVVAWKYHVQALARIIESSGPHAFKQGNDMRLFLRARSVIMVLALEDRKRTFLADDPWQSIPWSDAPDTKSYINRFIDINLCMPSIMEDLDHLQMIENPEEQRRMCDEIRKTITSLSKRLLDTRFDWEILNPNAAREVVPSKIPDKPYSPVDENGNLLFDSLIYYRNLQLCFEMSIYFSIVFFLRNFNQAIGEEEEDILDTPPLGIPRRSNPALKLPHELRSLRDSAVEVCRSVEYFLQSNHGISGAYFLMFPLRIAQFAFEEEEDYAIVVWIRKVMRYIGDEYGFSNALRFAVPGSDGSGGS
ncbi:DNA-directed RNA polymerase I subunit A43 [Talaromyces islandicus]|uniref:DNA-directed RNA polymerase I subunit RPA43 n=1 Tax=Talaromyces islandicus TaxID=28573 RepID=A0A0U1M856_TALIS|nr:DNA-directed RNA polymerase I subunit A43 [Talaromyces islandicus]